MRNGSGQEDDIVVMPAMLTDAHNSVESDLGEAAAFKAMDHPPLAANQAIPTHVQSQSSFLDDVPTEPHQASVSDPEHLASQSQSQSQFWQVRPCTTESAVPSYTLSEQEFKMESGEGSISNAYSQGLLNTLTRALHSSGVDLSQTSISVQFDVGKRANTGQTATVFSEKSKRGTAHTKHLEEPVVPYPKQPIRKGGILDVSTPLVMGCAYHLRCWKIWGNLPRARNGTEKHHLL
ncbi:hypothetical protein Acr_02g0011480 [Actinidia rufa]|uniref:Uncharacterized protein n=1 Tax=Actinidia rufa TaxID=165716 RepID=A0A7J0E8W8_9ERIC|nr:hypothetical protein Acr_02g0011480 [Actinidia rufa]